MAHPYGASCVCGWAGDTGVPAFTRLAERMYPSPAYNHRTCPRICRGRSRTVRQGLVGGFGAGTAHVPSVVPW